MPTYKTPQARAGRKAGRRHPLASIALVAVGLLFTGGAYAAFSTSTASAQADLSSQQTIDEGKKLFAANCATCHGLSVQGTGNGPSLIGVGAAAVDFQVGTGRMPLAMSGPQAQKRPVQFTEEQIAALAGYVASLAPGPAIPEGSLLDGTAEAIPLPDGSAHAVTVAQAFHWFDPQPALTEIARVLEPGGGLGLVWNERAESVPWVAALSDLMNWGVQRPYQRHLDWVGLVAESGRFTPLQHRQLSYQQELDADTLVDRALSTSYIAARPAAENVELTASIRALVADFPARFELPYVTDVYWCHRA